MENPEKKKIDGTKLFIIITVSVLVVALVIGIIVLCNKSHEHMYLENVVKPTCTEKGYTEYTCKECGDVYQGNEVNALGHSYGDWVVVKEATEQEEGKKEKTCSVCGDKVSESIAKVDHQHDYKSVVVDATCTEKGYTEYTCACGDTYKEEIAALGHTEVVIPGKEATCTEKGLTEGKKCSVCNVVTVEQTEIQAKGHTFGDWTVVKDPTDTEEGLKERVCSVCSEKETNIIPELNHVHSYTREVVEPTCTEKGYTKFTCRCGDKYTSNEVNAKGHKEVVVKGKEATCTEKGLTEGKKCSVCNVVTVAQTEIQAKGHTEVAIKGKEATCTEKGLTDGKKCSVCNVVTVAQTEIQAKGHTEVVIPGKEATCTTTGLTEGKKCSVCQATTQAQTVIQLQPHTEVVIKGKEATCTEKGLSDGKQCSVCNKVLVAQTETPIKDHNYVEGTCTVCGAVDPDYEFTITVEVSNTTSLKDALENENVDEIVLTTNMSLNEAFVIDRDVTIDLNGNRLTTVASVEFITPSTLSVNKDCTVTIKNGTIIDNAAKTNGGFHFIYVYEGATLNLENVDINISISPEVTRNNTMDRWQSSSAEHRIIRIQSNANVNLKNSNISITATPVTNFTSYTRLAFTLVGVYFGRNSQNSSFVMEGGSFTIKATDPVATTSTDTIYFIKSDRQIETNATASNKVELKGNVNVTLGGLNTKGQLNSVNNMFYLGDGYYKGYTYYSGIKTYTMSTSAAYNVDGMEYTLNTAEAKVWDLEGICQKFGLRNSDKAFYNSTEIEYHFICTSCGRDHYLTLADVSSLQKITIGGVSYPRCPKCNNGGLKLA